MQKMKKRTVRMLGLTLVGVLATVGALAATQTVDGIRWTYYLSGYEAVVGAEDYWSDERAVPIDTKGTITVPKFLGGRPVTQIGPRAFFGCGGLTSVTIQTGVTSIDIDAFGYCTNLTSVTIPHGVTNIGDSAFCYCYRLQSLSIPETVTDIGNSAFHSC